MGLFSSLKQRFGGAPAGGAGSLPWPQLVYGNYLTGFESFASLWRNSERTLDPRDANEGLDNVIVQSCLYWMATSMPNAKPFVGSENEAGEVIPVARHPFLDVYRRPNPTYNTKLLVASVNDNLWRKGNAYVHLVENNRGQLTGLDWIPTRYIRPIPDSSGHLDYYEYSPQGKRIGIDPAKICHFRFFMDEFNPLQGTSPLAVTYREIIADNALSNWAAGIARSGIPDVVFSPAKTSDGKVGGLNPADAATIQRQFAERMRSEPGAPRFLSGALDMHKLGVEPDRMAINAQRAQPETRIPAMFGIPPIVLGLMAGLDKATYSNYQVAVGLAWYGCLIPTLNMIAETLSLKCMQYFGEDPDGIQFRYDFSHIPELRLLTMMIREQARNDYLAGLRTIEEARSETGLATTPEVLRELQAASAARMQQQQQFTSAVSNEEGSHARG